MTHNDSLFRKVSFYVVLTSTLVLMFPWQNLSAQGGYLDLGDSQKVSLCVDNIMVNVQRWKPGELRGFGWGEITVDGVRMTAAQLFDTLKQLVTAAAGRGGVSSNRALIDWLGPFGDFEIINPVMAITGPISRVDCTYLLTATGEKTAPGLIELEKPDQTWRITTVDGLLSFLAAEVKSRVNQKVPHFDRAPSKKTGRK